MQCDHLKGEAGNDMCVLDGAIMRCANTNAHRNVPGQWCNEMHK